MITNPIPLFNFAPNSRGNKEMSVKVTVSLNSFLTTACTKSFVIFSALCMLEGKTEESQVAHRGQGSPQLWQGGIEEQGIRLREMTQGIEM